MSAQLPDPIPLPAGPLVWVLTLGPDTGRRERDEVYEGLWARMAPDVRSRSRVVVLAPGFTLQILDDGELRRLGLQRIEAR
jgi:hypothetical protein